jgi:hypothetical protein
MPPNKVIGGQGLAGCTRLRTLLAAGNRLARAADVARLAECAALVTLDLQENQLADPQVPWRPPRPYCSLLVQSASRRCRTPGARGTRAIV